MQTQNMGLVIGLMLAKFGVFKILYYKEVTLNFIFQIITNFTYS